MGGTTIGTKALREFERRAATQRREAKARRDGSSGPASSCRLIDPQSGAVLGEYQPHQFEPPAGQLTLTFTPPKVRRSDWKAAQRQHRGRTRAKHGIKPLTVPTRYDRLVEALLLMTRLTEKQALNERSVRAAVAKLVDDTASEWLRRR